MPKNLPYTLLGISSLASSRLFYALFDDPEGPNLLIVVILGIFLFVPASFIYIRFVSLPIWTRLHLSVLFELGAVLVLFFCLR